MIEDETIVKFILRHAIEYLLRSIMLSLEEFMNDFQQVYLKLIVQD